MSLSICIVVALWLLSLSAAFVTGVLRGMRIAAEAEARMPGDWSSQYAAL